ncbi:MAG: hypothetical protein J0653_04935, partial [Deltaproteobacteria bacterium]|nr:hypothetical protein [Deltaproteobacteria bacterium]
ENTEIVSDLALQGNSFFALGAPNTTTAVATQDLAYLTRAGAFRVDSAYNLVNPDRYVVLQAQGGLPILFPHTHTAAVAATSEMDTITFGAVGASETVTIGGVTYTDSGAGSTAAQVAACFAANVPSGYTLTTDGSANTPPTLVLTAANAGATTDLTITGTGAGTQSIAVVQGVSAVNADAGYFQKITAVDSQGVITYSDVNGDAYYYSGNGNALLPATTANYSIARANGTIAVV